MKIVSIKWCDPFGHGIGQVRVGAFTAFEVRAEAREVGEWFGEGARRDFLIDIVGRVDSARRFNWEE